jgi:hypothetical protein
MMLLRRLVLSFAAAALVAAVPSRIVASQGARPPQDPPTQVATPATLPPPQAAPPRPSFSNRNVRLDVTVTLKHDTKPVVKKLVLVAADSRETKGRAGIEIPIATSMAAGPTAPTTFSYRSVGVNVDATPQILDATHVLVRMSLEFSTVYKPETGQAERPSFGQGSHEARAIVFESGKPLVVTQAADAESGREYTVEVKATILP